MNCHSETHLHGQQVPGEPNPPPDLLIMGSDGGFGDVPDYQQGVGCKAPRSDD
jgi:hypothetical protein